MSDLRKAAELALKALEELRFANAPFLDEAMEALRQALAQPVQEQPKHWSDCSVYNEPAYPSGECDCGGFDLNNKWHGLTEEEAEKLAFDVIVGGVSKALAQTEQEPVVGTKTWVDGGMVFIQNLYASDIYTAPPKRELVGLTDEEIEDEWQSLMAKYIEEVDSSYWGRCDFEFARAIEAKLKEKNT